MESLYRRQPVLSWQREPNCTREFRLGSAQYLDQAQLPFDSKSTPTNCTMILDLFRNGYRPLGLSESVRHRCEIPSTHQIRTEREDVATLLWPQPRRKKKESTRAQFRGAFLQDWGHLVDEKLRQYITGSRNLAIRLYREKSHQNEEISIEFRSDPPNSQNFHRSHQECRRYIRKSTSDEVGSDLKETK